MRRWVARLACGHDIGDKTTEWPKAEDYRWCDECESGRMVMEVITDEPLTGPDGKR